MHAFREYKVFLKRILAKNPNNIEATCQLAITCFELREGSQNSVHIIEKLLENNLQNMTDDEKSRVYINLAYFYDEDGQNEKCFDFLKKAVSLNSEYPNAYNQLGTIYYTSTHKNDLYYCAFDEIEELKNTSSEDYIFLFEKAYKLSPEPWYQYNYGVALYSIGEYEQARCHFEKIALSHNTPLHMKGHAKFAYALSLYFLNERTKALKVITDLESTDYADESDIANFYFLNGNYQKHIDTTDEINYVNDANWLGEYFYALKSIGKLNEAEEKFCNVIQYIDQEIKDMQEDDDYNTEEKQQYIERELKTKREITEVYYNVMNGNLIPKSNIILNLNYGCYLIDCPRCQNE